MQLYQHNNDNGKLSSVLLLGQRQPNINPLTAAPEYIRGFFHFLFNIKYQLFEHVKDKT